MTIAQKSRMAANLRIKPTATKSGIWKYFDDCLDGQPKFKRIQFSLGRWNAQIGDETCQLSRGTCQNFSPSLLSPWESLSSRSSGDLCKMDQTDLYFSWRLISYFSALILTNFTTALLYRVIIDQAWKMKNVLDQNFASVIVFFYFSRTLVSHFPARYCEV